MTNAEYKKLYSEARKMLGVISIQTIKKMKNVYIDASKSVAKSLESAKITGKSELTIAQWSSINKQLRNAADSISKSIEYEIPEAIKSAYKNFFTIDSKYILDAVAKAGDNAVELITPNGMANFGVYVNELVLRDLVTRQSQAGYTFKESVWNLFDKKGLPIGINGDYQYRIKNLIQLGNAQGRDGVKIASDIMEYVRNGKEAVFKPGRYGRLIPGTAEYKLRIPDNVDWRALRLVRSETYASLQNAVGLNAKMNPACNGEIDWILTAGLLHSCVCPDLAANSPYKLDKIPAYPHSSCMCNLRPRLRDHDEFIADLKDWANTGNGKQYLKDWSKQYTAVNAA